MPCTGFLEILSFTLVSSEGQFQRDWILSVISFALALFEVCFFRSSYQILSRSLHCIALELFDFALTPFEDIGFCLSGQAMEE